MDYSQALPNSSVSYQVGLSVTMFTHCSNLKNDFKISEKPSQLLSEPIKVFNSNQRAACSCFSRKWLLHLPKTPSCTSHSLSTADLDLPRKLTDQHLRSVAPHRVYRCRSTALTLSILAQRTNMEMLSFNSH